MNAKEHGQGGCCGGCGGGNVLGAAAGLLDQCEVLLGAVNDETYGHPSRLLQGGTIGKHLRHTLDHYQAIVGRTGAEPIDYDHRERGVAVESDRTAARGQISSLRAGLDRLEGTGGQDVRVRVMIAADGREAVLRSTIAREVAFATHHGIHHVAMMKAIAGEMGVELAEEIGKAPSTVNFERSGAS